MKYKLTQLMNVGSREMVHVNTDPIWCGGAIAAHQLGIIDLKEHIHFQCAGDVNRFAYKMRDWCIVEDKD